MSEWQIGPLTKDHARSGFDCGVPALNSFIIDLAGQHQKKRACQVYVATSKSDSTVIGYHTLSAASVPFDLLSQEQQRRLAPYASAPAALLGRLAVRLDKRGKGLGDYLMAHALATITELSTRVGVSMAVVDAKNDRVKQLYQERFGFIPLRGARPLTLVLLVETITKSLKPNTTV